jgi:hypothetical protein
MPVATGDAFRYITTSGTNVGESDATLIAPDSKGTLTIVGGFGITLTADAANRKITISNTGNGTGALTTITTQNSAGIYYPIFTRAPTGGDLNPATGTYQMSTMYYETTTDPLTYNPGTGTLSVVNLSLSGNLTVNGVTVTGTTGTGNLVFSNSPTFTGTISLPTVLIGPQANLTRFPNALASVSTTLAGIQQNEAGNIGLIAEAVAGGTNKNAGLYGVGYTAGTFSAAGVIGEGHVSATGDATSSVGVRGYATDTHSSGMNIGLYGNASGSSVGNYALYMGGGDIYNNGGATTWTMTGNMTFAGAYTVTIPTLSVTGHATLEGVTSTGATGTGKLVFDNAPTISGHPTIEGVTSTGATGTGKFVFDTAPTIAGGSHTGITSLGIRDTSAAFDVTLAATSSTTLTAGRTLTIDVVNAARTVKLGGNLTHGANFTTDSNAISIATTGSTSITLPTSGTLYGTASSSITSSQLATSMSDETGSGSLVFATSPTLSGALTLSPAAFEQVNVASTQATGTVNVDVKTNTVWYFTGNALANWTFNFRGDGSTTLETFMATSSQSLSVAFLVTQGVTAYYPSAFTIDGNASGGNGYTFSVKWLGGGAPSAGNASSIDSYTFTLIKTGAKTYTILASQARFA